MIVCPLLIACTVAVAPPVVYVEPSPAVRQMQLVQVPCGTPTQIGQQAPNVQVPQAQPPAVQQPGQQGPCWAEVPVVQPPVQQPAVIVRQIGPSPQNVAVQPYPYWGGGQAAAPVVIVEPPRHHH